MKHIVYFTAGTSNANRDIVEETLKENSSLPQKFDVTVDDEGAEKNFPTR